MAGELKHKDAGGELTQTEDNAIDRHEASGQTTNDIFYYNGTSWIRSTLTTYLASQKDIVIPDDGVAQFGTLDGSPTIRGGFALWPNGLIVQPKDGNNYGLIMVVPSGTDNRGALSLLNDSDLSNFGYVTLYVEGTQVYLAATAIGSGVTPNRFRIDMDTCPGQGGVQGLGDDSFWWKHVMATEHITHASVTSASPVSGIISDLMTAGENVIVGDAVYMKSDGKLWKADADGTSTMPIMALAAASISADATGQFLLQGFLYREAWDWTVGGIIYSNVTPGALSQTAPVGSGDQVQVVGVAITADIIYFNPSLVLEAIP